MTMFSLKSVDAATSHNNSAVANLATAIIQNNTYTSSIMPSLGSTAVASNVTFTNFESVSKSKNVSAVDLGKWISTTISPAGAGAGAGGNSGNISISDIHHEHEDSADDILFILIPILLILTLAFFSGFALMCVNRRQKLDRLRHRLIPIYTFTHDEDDEWGVLIDNDRNAINNAQQQQQQQQQQQTQPPPIRSHRKSLKSSRK